MTTILVTGFSPFGGAVANPSQQIAECLEGETIGGVRVAGLVLPVQMGADAEALFAAMAEHSPALVLSLGQAAGATCLDVERFAVNLRFAGDVDPGKPVPPDRPQSAILAGGPDALMSTLDAERLARAVRAAGVPARAHGYAGAYACNHILYHALSRIARLDLKDCRAGFIHLPLSSEQAIAENKLHLPSLPLALMTAGVRAAIEEALL